MNIDCIIQTILEKLGGLKFILMTNAKFSYGIDEKQQPYLRCLLPNSSRDKINCIVVVYDTKHDLYQLTLAQLVGGMYKIVKVLDAICAENLITTVEVEIGISGTMATLI